MLNVNDLNQAILSAEFALKEAQQNGKNCPNQQDKIDDLRELVKAVTQGLVRK